jgi:hypothetical protein
MDYGVSMLMWHIRDVAFPLAYLGDVFLESPQAFYLIFIDGLIS